MATDAPLKNPAHQRGWSSERFAEQFFFKKGWAPRARRWRTPFAEIDLCLYKRIGGTRLWLLVEVKTLSEGSRDFLENRISFRQREKLLLAREWVEDRMGGEVALVAAYVHVRTSGEIAGVRVRSIESEG